MTRDDSEDHRANSHGGNSIIIMEYGVGSFAPYMRDLSGH